MQAEVNKEEPRFVSIFKGVYKGCDGYIVGETEHYYWIKICSDCHEQPKEKKKISKHNVLHFNSNIPKLWISFATTDILLNINK